MGEANRRWREQLGGWAIPEHILAVAPEPPWGFDVQLFSRIADAALAQGGVSHERAREALPDGGVVLDVGCGAGAASLPLVPPAARLVGVDESPGMLEVFATRAPQLGAQHHEIEGRWPDVADQAPVADVVVCTNVVYNVPDLEPFLLALGAHASGRVVVELTAEHPLGWMRPYWRTLHGVERPAGPDADDAVTVAAEAGFPVQMQRWEKPAQWEHRGAELVAFVRKRLCLSSDRDEEVRRAVDQHPPAATRSVVTLWWDT